MMDFRAACTALFLCTATPLSAHPHVFVDISMTLRTNDAGQVTEVEVTWAYDELYSLLILEDMGLDPDADGVLTEAELQTVKGFDLNWIEGFQGDLYAVGPSGDVLVLGAPVGTQTVLENGMLVSGHVRRFVEPVSALTLRAYDPTFYTAYDLQGRVTAPEGCTVGIEAADLDKAYTLVEEALYKNPPKNDDEYPEVGEAFADVVRVECGR